MIRLRDVHGGYPKKEILFGVDLDINCGELVCIIGKNGCGKTTLIRTAAGLLKPRFGDILCGDAKIYRMKPKERGRNIAYLSQGKTVPHMTAFDYVLHGRFPYICYPSQYLAYDRDMALLAMERLGVAHLCDTPVSQLSGGIRQRVYIAMAVCQGADHILLDEPASAADKESRAIINSLVVKYQKQAGCTVIMTSHTEELPLFEKVRIINLCDGRITETREENNA